MSFITFAFWNLNKHDLSREIVDLCSELNIDIIILAEHENIDENIIRFRFSELNLHYKLEYIDKKSKVIVIRKAIIGCSVIREGFRYSTYKITYSKDINLLLFAVHLPSQLHKSESEITTFCCRVKNEIESIERECGNNKSLIVGDFNMNPFSKGMIDVYAFNSIMCKKTSMKIKRRVDKQDMYYFYNPMWHVMGNRDNNVLGSYYHHKCASSYVWNSFDQVIIRPHIVELLDEKELKFINEFGKHNLIKSNGKLDTKRYSDHLPLLFKLKGDK